jgi:hypothetical protein
MRKSYIEWKKEVDKLLLMDVGLIFPNYNYAEWYNFNFSPKEVVEKVLELEELSNFENDEYDDFISLDDFLELENSDEEFTEEYNEDEGEAFEDDI